MDWSEEEEFFNLRKEKKQERKIAARLDRSKFKKTDQDQKKKHEVEKPISENVGIVASIQSQICTVRANNQEYQCVLRGTLKQENENKKNLVIVGDSVGFDLYEDGTGAIHTVYPRKTVLSRADHLSQKKEHLIAANVDQVFIVVSVVDPLLRPTIIDRYLIAAMKGGLDPVILINKVDLLQSDTDELEDQQHLFEECMNVYRALNIPIVAISVENGFGIDELKKYMKGKTSVFSGQSGTGKSSLINAISGSTLRVQKTVQKTKKGSHTTSTAILIPLDQKDSYCIDTPGIKSFGIWDLELQEIRFYFSEFEQFSSKCRYLDCKHISEENCAVKAAVEEGNISSLRYFSYVSIYEAQSSEHARR